MKRIFLVIAFFAASSAAAQDKQWTFGECIDYAVENNIDIRQTELDVKSAELNLNTTQLSRLPTLNAGMGQTFSFGRAVSEDDNNYIDTQASNTSLNISTGVTVFEGFRINRQVQADKLDLKAAIAGLERAKESLELNVASLYLEVLFKKEVMEVFRKQAELTRQQVENTRAMVDQGKVAHSQLLDIEAESAQNEVNRVGAENELALSLLNLSQALNLPQTEGFDVATVDPTVDYAPLRNPDEIYQTALDVKPQVRQAQLNLQSAERGVQIARAGYWPSLSLGASASDGYFYMFGQDFAQEDLATQLRNKHGENVGLNLSIPIFNGNSVRNRVRGAKLQAQNLALELDAVKLSLYKEIQQAWQSSVSAYANRESTTKALAASQEAFRAMELRYASGKATAFEFAQASTNLAEAQSNAAQARFDYLFSVKIVDFYLGQRIEL